MLDPVVKISNNKFATDIFGNVTDRHQYLHYTPPHPERTKRSILYGQALRLCCICSVQKDFVKHSCKMKSWFFKWGISTETCEY